MDRTPLHARACDRLLVHFTNHATTYDGGRELMELPIVGDVRGRGFFWAMELVGDADARTFDKPERDRLLREFLPGRLLDAGWIARADDRGDAVLQIAPPPIADSAMLGVLVERLGDVLADAGTHMGILSAMTRSA